MNADEARHLAKRSPVPGDTARAAAAESDKKLRLEALQQLGAKARAINEGKAVLAKVNAGIENAANQGKTRYSYSVNAKEPEAGDEFRVANAVASELAKQGFRADVETIEVQHPSQAGFFGRAGGVSKYPRIDVSWEE